MVVQGVRCWKYLINFIICETNVGMQSATVLYLCSVVVHGQHAEHVQGVSTFDEFPNSVWQNALASLLCGGCLVAGWIGQLIHADNAVLRGTQGLRV